MILALSTVGLRIYSRLAIKRKLATDDVLIILATAAAITRTVISCMSAADDGGYDKKGQVYSLCAIVWLWLTPWQARPSVGNSILSAYFRAPNRIHHRRNTYAVFHLVILLAHLPPRTIITTARHLSSHAPDTSSLYRSAHSPVHLLQRHRPAMDGRLARLLRLPMLQLGRVQLLGRHWRQHRRQPHLHAAAALCLETVANPAPSASRSHPGLWTGLHRVRGCTVAAAVYPASRAQHAVFW